jgi:hypothetical protein
MNVTAVASQSIQTQPTPPRVAPNDANTNSVSNSDSASDQVQISPAAKALQAQGGQADPDHDGK